MGLKDSLVTFLAGIVVGTGGIHLGALFVVGTSTVQTAFITALIGSVIWFLFSHFIGWIPILGLVATFIAWLGAVNARYPGGLMTAGKIAAIAWVASVVADYILRELGVRKAHAVGVPLA